MNTIIITAADTKFFTLVQGTILSIRENPQGKDITIAFFDLGCNAKELEWLRSHVNIIKQPNWDFDFPSRSQSPEYLKGLLARPFLRKYFSNFDVYLWIDADAWVQDWRAVELYIQGAVKRGLAIAPELDRGYSLSFGKLPWYWQFVRRDYETFFGAEVAEKFYTYPTLNAGIFALHCDAPHWQVWERKIREALERSAGLMTDQVALNLLVYSELFDRTELLPAWCNWSCNFGLPFWDKQRNCFVEPYLPHTQIGIFHLTGHKHDRLQVTTTEGDRIEVSTRYQSTPNRTKNQIPQNLSMGNRMLEETSIVIENVLLPNRDYVSPGLQIIQPDRCFPNMILGDANGCKWKYLRREIPHNWYVDRRYPFVGFLSRDEAHILYNTALKFKSKRALEIGCWMGWSACHIALAGVNLEIIDPLLSQSPNQESVISSLESAAKEFGTFAEVKLIAGYSPQKVDELAIQQQRKWSLIFIDGNHDAPYPLNDAITCEKYAEADAMILFHDLSSPEVSQGLDYLRDRGWHTMIYQTMQIMGVAWRGNVEPVQHIPDPNITWQLPQHLAHYQNNRVNGGRLWSSSLPKGTLSGIQHASFKHTYKGVLMQKNPFDFALYHMLLWQIKPKTIIEIGSCYGGSALWMADLLHTFDIDDGHIYSIDLNRVTSVQHPRATFLEGDQTTLDKVLSTEFINSLPRPLLVIEDGAHFYHTSLAVLEFFHPYLKKDEYIIIEDGIISDLGGEASYQGGPNRALQEFLEKHRNEYAIDTNYCDFFGHNITWNTNGYLKKVAELNPVSL